MSEKRHFTVVEGNKEHGLYVGRTPSSVAKKVVSKLSKGKKVVFELREITQGSKKKVYGPYEGIKKKLKEPRKVGDRVYKYESIVKKIEKKGAGWFSRSPEIPKSIYSKILNLNAGKNAYGAAKTKQIMFIKNRPLSDREILLSQKKIDNPKDITYGIYFVKEKIMDRDKIMDGYLLENFITLIGNTFNFDDITTIYNFLKDQGENWSTLTNEIYKLWESKKPANYISPQENIGRISYI